MVKGPDGGMMPAKAAEQAWKIFNAEQAQLSALRVQDRRRGVATREQETAREQAGKDRATREGRVAARWEKITTRVGAFARRLRDDMPLLFTLITVSVSLTVALSAQWMFYDTLPWPPGFGWLVVPMALLVESGSWTYGVQAQRLAELGMPYGAKVRRMWLLALLAAGMNSYHGSQAFPGHWEMGLILGGGSVLGPLAWHGYLQLTKVKAQRRSGAEIRAAIGRRIHHPILTWRAHDLRSSLGGRISPERAFLIVFRDHYGYLPGQRPRVAPRLVRVATVRVAWRPVTVGSGADLSAESGARLSVVDSAELTPPVIVSSADDSPSAPPALALVGGDGSAEPDAVDMTTEGFSDEEIERFLSAYSDPVERPDSALSSGQTSTSGPVSGQTQRPPGSVDSAGPVSAESSVDQPGGNGSPEALSQRPDERSTQRPKPRGKGRRSARNKDRVREFVDQQLAAGADRLPTGSEVAKALGIGESTARNLLAVIKPELSDRHQQ